MTAKRIPGLTAISGASTANDDDFLIFDTDADTTKRISRSQLAAAVGADMGVVVNRFNGTGSQTDFTLTKAPTNENSTMVFVGGVYQQKNTYSVSGVTLSFSSPPVLGTNNIEVNIFAF